MSATPTEIGAGTAHIPAATASRQGADQTPRLLAVGGILGALGAASCCVIPFALFLAGVSGAWIGNLTALEPYQPIFAGVSLAFIGYGAWRLRRKRESHAPTVTAPRRNRTGSRKSGSGRRRRWSCWPSCFPMPLVTSSEDAKQGKDNLMIVRAGIFAAFGLMLAPLTAQAGEATVVLSVHHADCNLVRAIVKNTLERSRA